jgi:DNA-binding transcriptional MerR regulator
MTERDHLSIGEVLNLLQEEFPDVTVSKIRFLESRGLIAPERTASGYRKFYDTDVERLRWILTQQKVHFLPLRVIRERLDQEAFDLDGAGFLGDDEDLDDDDLDDEPEEEAPRAARGRARRADLRAVDPPTASPRARLFERRERTVALPIADLAEKSGLALTDVRELERLGLLQSTKFGDESVYDDEALAVACLAARFKAHGVEGRHLRTYKVAAEREAGLYEQLLIPVLKRSDEGRTEALDRLEELADLGEQMRAAMLRLVLDSHLR